MNKAIVIPRIKKPLFIILFIVSHIFIINNIFFLSKDMIYGDLSGKNVIPPPTYGFLRVPDKPFAVRHDAQNRLAGDFAQIYFPSNDPSGLIKNYRSGYLDPWNRESRIAPLVHYLCAITFCRLNYGYASILHILIQTLIFYFFFALSFKMLGVEKNLLPGLFLANIYLFLTPAGLAWFERGQYSLYVTTSYLLLILGLMKKNYPLVLISAFFAFIKWTSFPFVFIVLSVFLLNSKSLADGKRNILLAAVFLLTIISLSLWAPDAFKYFLEGILNQERFSTPDGVSLARILPISIVKTMPIILILLGYLHIRVNCNIFIRNLPYLIGSAILLLTYPTKAYEYSVPCLLCFIPLIYYWSNMLDTGISPRMREVMKYSLFLFIGIASYSKIINGLIAGVIAIPSIFTQTIGPIEFLTFGEYFLISAFFLIFPLVYHPKPAPVIGEPAIE